MPALRSFVQRSPFDTLSWETGTQDYRVSIYYFTSINLCFLRFLSGPNATTSWTWTSTTMLLLQLLLSWWRHNGWEWRHATADWRLDRCIDIVASQSIYNDIAVSCDFRSVASGNDAATWATLLPVIIGLRLNLFTRSRIRTCKSSWTAAKSKDFMGFVKYVQWGFFFVKMLVLLRRTSFLDTFKSYISVIIHITITNFHFLTIWRQPG